MITTLIITLHINEGRLVKYDHIDTDDIKHIAESNVDHSTKANGHNEQETIKIRTTNQNEWWFCFDYKYVDPINIHNNINNNN